MENVYLNSNSLVPHVESILNGIKKCLIILINKENEIILKSIITGTATSMEQKLLSGTDRHGCLQRASLKAADEAEIYDLGIVTLK